MDWAWVSCPGNNAFVTHISQNVICYNPVSGIAILRAAHKPHGVQGLSIFTIFD